MDLRMVLHLEYMIHGVVIACLLAKSDKLVFPKKIGNITVCFMLRAGFQFF